ncbi:MAG: hypothetical protein AAFY15_12820 [Cyanobacteria bacterium J06648_11]
MLDVESMSRLRPDGHSLPGVWRSFRDSRLLKDDEQSFRARVKAASARSQVPLSALPDAEWDGSCYVSNGDCLHWFPGNRKDAAKAHCEKLKRGDFSEEHRVGPVFEWVRLFLSQLNALEA